MQEMQKTQLWSLSQEDPREEEMATHSSILAQKIPWTEEPGEATVHGVTKELDMTKQLNNNSNNRRTWICTLLKKRKLINDQKYIKTKFSIISH